MTEWQKEVSKFEGLFSPRSPREFVLFFALTVAVSKLSDLLGEIIPSWIATAGSIGGIAILFLAWWLWDRRVARRRSAAIAFKATHESPSPAPALILLVGPYDPKSSDERFKDEAIRAATERILTKPLEQLTEADFEGINLHQSNLRPQISAIEFHARSGVLRHVWLIGSKTTDTRRGAEEAAALLERYVKIRWTAVNVSRTIDGRPLVVEPWNYTDLWELAETIFRRSWYREGAILADVTGGTKMMSVALSMACIPPARKIQYMDSERDAMGRPVPAGEIVPVLIDVDPILYHYV